MEDTTPLDDDWDVNIRLAEVEWFMGLRVPTAQQAALVSVVTGVLAGALQFGSTTRRAKCPNW